MAVAGCGVLGCRESSYELAPVRGTVSIDGQPLTSGKLMFAPITSSAGQEAGKAALGLLQPDGSYVLTTYEYGDGAVVGEHWVSILRLNTETPPVTPASQGGARVTTFRRLAIRQRQTVVAGQDNQIDIHLTSQEVARLGR